MVGNAETLRTQRNGHERNPFTLRFSHPAFQERRMGEPASNAAAVVAASRTVAWERNSTQPHTPITPPLRNPDYEHEHRCAEHDAPDNPASSQPPAPNP